MIHMLYKRPMYGTSWYSRCKIFALQRQELGEEGKYDCWVGMVYGDDIKVNKITNVIIMEAI